MSKELQQQQQDDPDLRIVIGWMKDGKQKPKWEAVSAENNAVKTYWAQWDRLAFNDGVLHRRWETDDGKQIRWQLLVPKTLRHEVLAELHDSKIAGHLGVNKTTGRVKERFYWPNCARDVKEWCKKCKLCVSRAGPRPAPKAQMKTHIVGAPLERVALDVMGPLPVSKQGNKFILVIGDYFTKWKEAYAMPDQTAVTVATIVINEFVSRFGVPQQMHSDQGRNFESAVFQEMCRLLGIDKTRTTPLRPQSDGMIERFNQTIEAMLSKFVTDNHNDWDEHLPLLMMAYRSAEHESSGYSPSELMLGRTTKLPIDLVFSRPQTDQAESQELPQYVATLRDRMEIIHDFARNHLKLSSERQKRQYDHKAHKRSLNVGDIVRLHNPQRKKGRSPKFCRPWEGPYVVTHRLDDLIYRIQKSAKSKPKVVHIDRLKTTEEDFECDWLHTTKDTKTTEEASQQQPQTVSDGQKNNETTQTAKDDDSPPELQPSKRPTRQRRPPAWTADYEMNTDLITF